MYLGIRLVDPRNDGPIVRGLLRLIQHRQKVGHLQLSQARVTLQQQLVHAVRGREIVQQHTQLRGGGWVVLHHKPHDRVDGADEFGGHGG